MFNREYNWNQIMWIGVVVVIILVLWNSVFLYPFKLFVVLIHEISHALAALLTGGAVESITLSVNEGGVTKTFGGNEMIIISAGYVGSFIFGLVLLGLSRLRRGGKIVLILLAVLISIVAILYVDTTFAFIFCMLFAIGLIMFSIFLGFMSDFFLKILGVLTCLYAVLDIKSDLFFNKAENDAVILQNITGIPAIFFTLFWIAIIALVLGFFVLTKNKQKSKQMEID